MIGRGPDWQEFALKLKVKVPGWMNEAGYLPDFEEGPVQILPWAMAVGGELLALACDAEYGDSTTRLRPTLSESGDRRYRLVGQVVARDDTGGFVLDCGIPVGYFTMHPIELGVWLGGEVDFWLRAELHGRISFAPLEIANLARSWRLSRLIEKSELFRCSWTESLLELEAAN